MTTASLNTNQLAFIALCNEYCALAENAREMQRQEFIDAVLRLLPRIYISALDLKDDDIPNDEFYMSDSLDEEYYDSIRRNMEVILGPDDGYLEVFEEDMKYSDTPIAASISENLADIFQVLFNFVENVKGAPDGIIKENLCAIKEDFGNYWSQKLCNVLRALNNLRYSS